MEDLCAFKGWYGPQHFPDCPFLVRNLTLQAFQSFTLSVHVKMKRSLFLTMPHLTIASSKPLAADKARGTSHCANGPQPNCHCTVAIVAECPKPGPGHPVSPSPCMREFTENANLAHELRSWNFNKWWRRPWTWFSTPHERWLQIKDQRKKLSEGLY